MLQWPVLRRQAQRLPGNRMDNVDQDPASVCGHNVKTHYEQRAGQQNILSTVTRGF